MKTPAPVLLSGIAILLCACASTPTYGPADDEALEPVRKAHQDCLQQQISALINGSDDVGFLTEHIVGLCDPALMPAADYLSKRGFSRHYIGQFINEKRRIGSDATADVILRVKSRQNEAAPSAGPAPSM